MLIDPNLVETVCTQDHPGDSDWLARAEVPVDLTPLFPFLNAVIQRADYYPDVPAIIWMHRDHRIAMRPHELAVSHVADREAAVEEITGVVKWLNGIWERRGSIEPRTEPKKPTPLMSVLKLLPMNNCGECGLATCTAFAAGLIEGTAKPHQCPALAGAQAREKLLALRELGIS